MQYSVLPQALLWLRPIGAHIHPLYGYVPNRGVAITYLVLFSISTGERLFRTSFNLCLCIYFSGPCSPSVCVVALGLVDAPDGMLVWNPRDHWLVI